VPWTPLGKMTLNENIKNFHNEVLPLPMSCCARYSCSISVWRCTLHSLCNRVLSNRCMHPGWLAACCACILVGLQPVEVLRSNLVV
jgi:hypothetical protein